MKLKLKESIRAKGVQYRPNVVHIEGLPAGVIDADEIGITQADADVLVRRGTAELVIETATAETDEQRAEREADAPAEVAVDGEPVAEAKPAAKTAKKR